MGHARFVDIKTCLTLYDDEDRPRCRTSDPAYNRVWKVGRLLHALETNSLKLVVPGRYVSIDELMVGCKSKIPILFDCFDCFALVRCCVTTRPPSWLCFVVFLQTFLCHHHHHQCTLLKSRVSDVLNVPDTSHVLLACVSCLCLRPDTVTWLVRIPNKPTRDGIKIYTACSAESG